MALPTSATIMPATVKRPPVHVRGHGLEHLGGERPALLHQLLRADQHGPPPTRADREPWEPAPRTTRSVSPKTTSTQRL
jgi:hypothetical protein